MYTSSRGPVGTSDAVVLYKSVREPFRISGTSTGVGGPSIKVINGQLGLLENQLQLWNRSIKG